MVWYVVINAKVHDAFSNLTAAKAAAKALRLERPNAVVTIVSKEPK